MKNTNISAILKELITSRGGTCASLIIPVHELPAEKTADNLAIDHAVDKLAELLNDKDPVHSNIISNAKELAGQAKDINGVSGIGIYVSENIARLATFPFEVKEKILVGDSFEIRDLVQKERYTREYFVLFLGGHHTRLFKGKENTLREYADNNFPASFDGVEYEIPEVEQQGDNSTSTLKREIALTTRSSKAFYNALDQKLHDYLSEISLLVIAGVEKELAMFSNHSAHQHLVRGKVTGNYADGKPELEEKSWEAIRGALKREESDLLKRLNEMGREFVSSGITQVWRDAKQGKGSILLVEKDLEKRAYAGMNDYTIELAPSRHEQPVIADAVDDVIETVIEKNGSVVFMGSEQLREYQGIAMINRF
jgi:hypothetical protein